jgi:hypothetical protein
MARAARRAGHRRRGARGFATGSDRVAAEGTALWTTPRGGAGAVLGAGPAAGDEST